MFFRLSPPAVTVLVLIAFACYAPILWSADIVPASLEPGDVITAVENTPIMQGANTLATARRGTEMKVVDLRGDWVGVSFEEAHKKISGWAQRKHFQFTTTATASVRLHNETLLTLPPGTVIVARRIQEPWIWVKVRQGNGKVSGWLNTENVVTTRGERAPQAQTQKPATPMTRRPAIEIGLDLFLSDWTINNQLKHLKKRQPDDRMYLGSTMVVETQFFLWARRLELPLNQRVAGAMIMDPLQVDVLEMRRHPKDKEEAERMIEKRVKGQLNAEEKEMRLRVSELDVVGDLVNTELKTFVVKSAALERNPKREFSEAVGRAESQLYDGITPELAQDIAWLQSLLDAATTRELQELRAKFRERLKEVLNANADTLQALGEGAVAEHPLTPETRKSRDRVDKMFQQIGKGDWSGNPGLAQPPIDKGHASAVRTWSDGSGRQVEATYLGFERGKVRMRRKSDGKVFAVPLERLAATDQTFVQSQVANTGPAQSPFRPLPDLSAWEKAGAKIERDEQGRVVKLVLYDRIIDETDLAALASMPDLRELLLMQTHVGRKFDYIEDDQLRYIAPLRKLETLNLFINRLQGTGLANLKDLKKLRSLTLGAGRQLRDDALVHLQNFSKLESLDLAQTPISGAALVHIGQLKELSDLSLHTTKVNDAGLSQLRDLRNLKIVRLQETRVTGTGLSGLSGCSQMRQLYLGGTPLEDSGMKYIAQLTALETLDLGHTKITDEGAQHLQSLQNLKDLHLHGTKITDAAIPVLSQLTKLERLNLYGTKTTPDGVASLKAALPQCKIHK